MGCFHPLFTVTHKAQSLLLLKQFPSLLSRHKHFNTSYELLIWDMKVTSLKGWLIQAREDAVQAPGTALVGLIKVQKCCQDPLGCCIFTVQQDPWEEVYSVIPALLGECGRVDKFLMETLSEVLCLYLLWISWDYVFTGDYKSTFYWFPETDTTVFIHPFSVQNSLSNAWENSCVSACLQMSFSPLKLCYEASIPKVVTTYGRWAICNIEMLQFCIWEGEHLTGEELSESGSVIMEIRALWR